MKTARRVWNSASCGVRLSFDSVTGEGERGRGDDVKVHAGDNGGLDVAGVEGLDGEVEGMSGRSKWPKRSLRMASSLLTISIMRPRSSGSFMGGPSSSS